MFDYLKEANAIAKQVTQNRRALHQMAERGFDLPKTCAFVTQELKNLGLNPIKVGKAGLSVIIGHGDKCVLLRADMDALPMRETTGLPFASTGEYCHSCGHDTHTAMLLGAAKLLKEHEDSLPGAVKLMLQPAEELLQGAEDMVNAGILENPTVKAAFGLHVSVGQPESSVGTMRYSSGPALYSGDAILIRCIGKSAHGSTSYMGIDAIEIASHIVIALNELISREIPSTEHSVVLVGKISGGASVNTTAGECELEVSVRAETNERREFLKKRVKEIAESTAAVFRGKAIYQEMYGIAPLYCDPTIAALGAKCATELGIQAIQTPPSCGTEDFTAVAQRVPAVMLNLGAGSLEEGHTCSMHHPGMVVDEGVLPLGVALYCKCAIEYLKQ